MDPCWAHMEYHLTPVDYTNISSGEETVTANNWLQASPLISALMPRPHGGRWCFLTWINVQQVLRQQVCVVVGSALRSEWLLRARGRCRARDSVGGTSGWSSLEFLRTITVVCVFVYACVCEGQVLHTLWAPNVSYLTSRRKAAVVTIIIWSLF